MPPRVLLFCLVVWVAGCAGSTPRPDSEPSGPRYEHVFLKPLEEALAETRQLLSEKGYGFERSEDPTLMLTTWSEPQAPGHQWGNQSQYRYLVSGLRVGPRQSVVRIYRMWRTVISNNSEQRPNLYKFMQHHHTDFEAQEPYPIEKANRDRETRVGLRDLPLEKELKARLEQNVGIEVISRNVAPEPDQPRLRAPEFYLDRWKSEGTAQAPVVTPCPQEVRGLTPLLKPGLTLLVGEQLGSRETPAVVGDMVCQSSAAGFSVVLGLSIPRTEQERINRYLASPGAPSDQDELLRGPFWRRPFQDGRSSRAIMDLIDRVRALRHYGLFITLVAYDTEEAVGSKRDALLAEVWEARRKGHPDELFVILAGNTHTRTVEGTQWDRDFVPMAKRLVSSEQALLTFDLSYAQGQRWGCDLSRDAKLVCNIVNASPSERVAAPPGQSPYVKLLSERSEEGYHGLLYVGALSPSLPATSLGGHVLPPTSKPPTAPQRK
ncbi:hypothetical protein [Hyalangium sp.]|uniref:hypothetical protein n=1 Tax=Hyalangium sp. TaxID=2028555 RepID=UPI002D230D72|nr:hypothetical protein [Hyalangium sp.]HYH94683.1 hypothetical protein [Hyalangium sp.]